MVGASLMRFDTSTALRLKLTVAQLQLELFTGVVNKNMRKKMCCQLSEAVNGDFVSLPYVFFFLQNQSLIEPCPKPACLALPSGRQPCYLFLN